MTSLLAAPGLLRPAHFVSCRRLTDATNLPIVYDHFNFVKKGCPIRSRKTGVPAASCKDLPASVRRLHCPKFIIAEAEPRYKRCLADSQVYILGTKHDSPGSCQDVNIALRSLRPDVVVLELCQDRFEVVKTSVAKNGSRKRRWKLFGDAPGEFAAAVRSANELGNVTTVLGDRAAQTTIGRIYSVATFREALSYLWLSAAFKLNFGNAAPNPELFKRWQQGLPRIWNVWVTERDVYMTAVLQEMLPGIAKSKRDEHRLYSELTEGPIIVAITGAAHLEGITKRWDSRQTISSDMNTIPPSSIQAQILRVLWWTGKNGALLSFFAASCYLVAKGFDS